MNMILIVDMDICTVHVQGSLYMLQGHNDVAEILLYQSLLTREVCGVFDLRAIPFCSILCRILKNII